MKKFVALKNGDTIGIAASASPFDRVKFMKGVHALENMGFKVHYGHDIFDQNRYLAGTDERRARELEGLFLNRNISAIMFARGGYGSQRIIPMLNQKLLHDYAKPVIGFSDLTALLTFLRQTCTVPTLYGPVTTQLGSAKGSKTAEWLKTALTTNAAGIKIPIDSAKVLKHGVAEGPIVGGCLSLINSSLGTPYELNTKDKILFIEDVNEKIYVIDRMLTQLKNANMLDTVRAILFGSIIPPKDEPYNVEPMIMDVIGDFDRPVITGIPAGHIDDFFTLPLGANIEIIASRDEPLKIRYKDGLFQ